MAETKALADISSEQTSAVSTDYLFIEKAGTPAKISFANLMKNSYTYSGTMTVTGTFNLTNATLSGYVLDEDNFATDSATKPPSQQSTKAYVDAAVGSRESIAGGQFDSDGTLSNDDGFASITESSTGIYDVLFSNTQVADYLVVLTSMSTGLRDMSVDPTSISTTGFTFKSKNTSGNGASAPGFIEVFRYT